MHPVCDSLCRINLVRTVPPSASLIVLFAASVLALMEN